VVFASEYVLLGLLVEVDETVHHALDARVAAFVLFLLEGHLLSETGELELHKAITRLVLVMNYMKGCLGK
jgi:hypothetical protein